MEVQDFYTYLLDHGWPWSVKSVVFDVGAENVDVYLECAEAAQFVCPQCDRYCPVCDQSPPQKWRHMDTCGKVTYLHAKLPIVHCSKHGKQPLHPHWGSPDSPASFEFEQLVARLADGLGGIRKAANFLKMDVAQIRRILRHASCKIAKGKDIIPNGYRSTSQTPRGPKTRQLSLFGGNDMDFVNQGIEAFQNMELEKAVELFRSHQRAYPKGYDVTSRLAATEFLLRGIREASDDPSVRPASLYRLWNSFEDYVKSEPIRRDALAAEVKTAFFSRMAEEVQQCGKADSSPLPGSIPLGFIFLQAGRYEDAIRSLQSCIPGAPHNASLYAYLGDAYWLLGDPKVARQCYQQACLIDPVGIDWRHLQDKQLKELKQEMLLESGLDPELALQWLPSHARLQGLFERNELHSQSDLEALVEDYLALESALAREHSPGIAAKLFFIGIILCENREGMKFIKKIDVAQVRRMMKQANPDLFEKFLERVVEGKGSE